MPGAWGYARGGMGVGDEGAARGGRGGGRAGAARGAGGAGAGGGRPRGRRGARGRGGAARAGACSPTPTRCARPALAGVEAPRRLAPGGAGGEGDGAARRAARLSRHGPGEEPWQGRDRHRLHDGRPDAPRPRTPAPAGPRARPWIEAACQTATDDSLAPPGQPRAVDVLPVLPGRRGPRGRGRHRHRPLRRGVPGASRTGSSTAWRSGPRQLEERFGITGGHIFHGEMLPGPAARGPARPAARSAASRGSTWRARAPIPAAR